MDPVPMIPTLLIAIVVSHFLRVSPAGGGGAASALVHP